MEAYVNHIENSLRNEKETPILYNFKKEILNEMNQRANLITHTGLKDDKVLSDLVISEYPDMQKLYREYTTTYKEKKRKKRAILSNIVGSILYITCTIVAYLIISFATKSWATTWLIINGAMSFWLIFEFGLLIKKATNMKKIFHPTARLLLCADVMIAAQFVFLVMLIEFEIKKSWLVFIVGVILIFVGDAIYTGITKQKLAIINYLFYIPAVSPMIYILICEFGLTKWSQGWIVMPMAVLLDIIIICVKLLIRQKSKISYEEVE